MNLWIEVSSSYHSLVVDAGHTRVKLAHCRQDRRNSLPAALGSVAVIYDRSIDWAEVVGWFGQTPPQGVIVTGTNAQKAREIVDEWPAVLPAPFLLSDKTQIPLKVNVDFPRKVGIDRLLNSVAANQIRQPDQPVIIVNSGTAITIDVVDQQGTFQGGAILPGILLGAKSLHAETTTLPHVDVWELLKREPAALGKHTEAAIASGLYWGHLGAVKELVSRYTELLSTGGKAPLLLLTGGASVILKPYMPAALLDAELSLKGQALVARQILDPST